MSLGRIVVTLDMDASGAISGTFRTIGALRTLGAQAGQTSRQISGMDTVVSKLFHGLRDGVVVLGLARHAIQNLHAATTGWMMGIVKANAEIERMTNLMGNMSNAASAAGRLADGGKNVQWVIDFAKTAPFAMNSITDSFVKFKSVGLDPMDGSLRALADAVSAFGGSSETLKRASIAIQQMAGKGVISMEELRQQMGEAVPSSIAMMARAAGLSYGELVKLIALGRVEAKSALTLMNMEFDRSFRGTSQQMMNTWNGLMARLQTTWMEFMVTIGNSDYFDAVKEQLRDLVFFLGTDQAKLFAKNFGQAMATIIEYVRKGIDWIVKWRSTLMDAAKWIGIAFAAKYVVSFGLGLSGLVRGPMALLSAAVLSLGGRLAESSMAFAGKSVAVGNFGMKVMGAGFAVQSFGRFIGFLGGPITGAITLVLSLAGAYLMLKDNVEEAIETLRDTEFYDEGAVQIARQGLKVLDEEIKSIRESAAELDAGGNQMGLTKGQEERIRQIELLKKQAADQIARHEGFLYNDQVRKELEGIRKIQEGKTRAISVVYDNEMTALAKQYADKEISEDEFNKQRGEYQQKTYQEGIKAARAQIVDLRETLLRGAPSGVTKDAYRQRIEELNKSIIELTENSVLASQAGIKILDGTGTSEADKAAEKAKDTIASYIAKIQDAKAEMAGANGEAAKMRSLIDSGYFGPISGSMGTALEAAAKMWEEQNNQLKEFRRLADEAGKASDDLTKKIADSEVKLAEMAATFDSNLPTVFKKGGLLGYIAQVQDDLRKVDSSNMSPDEKSAEHLKGAEAISLKKIELIEQEAGAYKEKTASLLQSLMTEDEAKIAAYERERAEVLAMIELYRGMGGTRQEVFQSMYDQLAAMEKRHARDMEGPIEQMMRKWSDASKAMQEAGARWLDDLTSRLVEFTMTGKFKFTEFVESILRDILRIQTQKGFSKLFDLVADADWGSIISGMFGVGASAGSGANNWGSGAGQTQPRAHTGGVAGGSLSRMFVDPSVFAGAPKFHNGGLPGLRSNEVPIIAEKGEGIFTKEQMSAMGGKSNVTVNVINQSGQQVTAENNGPRFDGKQMVLDVVLKAASSPGGFRDNMRQLMK